MLHNVAVQRMARKATVRFRGRSLYFFIIVISGILFALA